MPVVGGEHDASGGAFELGGERRECRVEVEEGGADLGGGAAMFVGLVVDVGDVPVGVGRLAGAVDARRDSGGCVAEIVVGDALGAGAEVGGVGRVDDRSRLDDGGAACHLLDEWDVADGVGDGQVVALL